jgi:hypothetical protein
MHSPHLDLMEYGFDSCPQSQILQLLNEVRNNVNDLNMYAARENLASACLLTETLQTNEFDEAILNAEGMCSALEFQQMAPPEDRKKFRQLSTVFGKKLGFAM